MTDLHNINTPFGMLDIETQKALKTHTGPFEIFGQLGEWRIIYNPIFVPSLVYRTADSITIEEQKEEYESRPDVTKLPYTPIAKLNLSGETITVGRYEEQASDCVFITTDLLFEPIYISKDETQLLIRALQVASNTEE